VCLYRAVTLNERCAGSWPWRWSTHSTWHPVKFLTFGECGMTVSGSAATNWCQRWPEVTGPLSSFLTASEETGGKWGNAAETTAISPSIRAEVVFCRRPPCDLGRDLSEMRPLFWTGELRVWAPGSVLTWDPGLSTGLCAGFRTNTLSQAWGCKQTQAFPGLIPSCLPLWELCSPHLLGTFS
jgi:hypothetical protein